MNRLRLERDGPDHLRLRGIGLVVASCLLEVPETLPLAESGPARERLYPDVSDVAEIRDEWRELMVPELEHLFKSATDIMTADIAGLPDLSHAEEDDEFEIRFPRAHCDAWLSAINQARLILGAQFGVTDDDMHEAAFFALDPGKQQSVLRLHVLGMVMHVFLDFINPPGAT